MTWPREVKVAPLRVISVYTDEYMRESLKAARKASGLTLHQLAERLTLNKSTVSRIEAGKGGASWYRYIPKYFAWLRACGVSIEIRFIADSREFTHILPDSDNIE